jgi:hypothetical protein
MTQVVATTTFILKVLIQISTGIEIIVSGAFWYFYQTLQANSGIVLWRIKPLLSGDSVTPTVSG